MMVVAEQSGFEVFFPAATNAEIEKTKDLLKMYAKIKRALDDFDRVPPDNDRQRANAEMWGRMIAILDRAIRQIVDKQTQDMIEYRFMRGNSRAATIVRFGGYGYCDKTIDRRLLDGIISIANSLKYL